MAKTGYNGLYRCVSRPGHRCLSHRRRGRHILRLLVDAHDTEFSIPELVDATGVTRSTVWRAVDLLDSIDAIQIRETPQRNYIAINPDRLQKDDPILGISQSEFHAPIRAFVDRVQATTADADDINDLLGIVIFGSVARGGRPTERYRLLRGRRWQPDDSPPADNRRRRRSPVRAVRR